jgi:hypothetical protein
MYRRNSSKEEKRAVQESGLVVRSEILERDLPAFYDGNDARGLYIEKGTKTPADRLQAARMATLLAADPEVESTGSSVETETAETETDTPGYAFSTYPKADYPSNEYPTF